MAAWQWEGYPRYHQSLRNLLVHIVAVPFFLVGNLVFVVGLAMTAWWAALGGLVLSAVAFALQGLGHRTEPLPPVPFRGPANAVARVLLEQWVTFPRFVLSGGWGRNLRAAVADSGASPGSPA